MNITDEDRVVKRCSPIAAVPLSREYIFPEGKALDLATLLDHLVHEGRLETETLLELISRVTDIMTHEPNVVRLKDPLTIIGDLHGQFYDFVNILNISGGTPPERSFLLLGDYVDRGTFSVEILTYLYAMKLLFPAQVFLIRGNHESRDMSLFFNFRHECVYKYNQLVFDAFIKSFYSMPICAIVNDKYLCMHGGISPSLHTLSQLYVIDRFNEPPTEGLFCDILWADPDLNPKASTEFRANDARGCSYYFNDAAVTKFLSDNSLCTVIRAHEVQLEGFKMGPIRPETKLPSIITIFSAPNYCDQYGNKGAILNIINDELDIVQFEASPHPFYLPSFMNVFDWSVPFVAEKITELLHSIVHVQDNETSAISPTSREKVLMAHKNSSDLVMLLQDRLDSSHAGNRLRAKVKSVARLLALMRSVRQNREHQVNVHVRPGSEVPELAQSPESSPVQSKFIRAAEVDFAIEKRRPSKS